MPFSIYKNTFKYLREVCGSRTTTYSHSPFCPQLFCFPVQGPFPSFAGAASSELTQTIQTVPFLCFFLTLVQNFSYRLFISSFSN